MRKYNLFNFLEKKVDTAEISPVTQKILDQIAFKEIALHIGISYIANTLSKCEFKTFEEGKEVKNKLYYMLNVSPNPNQNSSQFINKFIENYYYYGHSLIVPQGNNIVNPVALSTVASSENDIVPIGIKPLLRPSTTFLTT